MTRMQSLVVLLASTLALSVLLSLSLNQSPQPPNPSGKTIRVLLSYKLNAGNFDSQYLFPSLELIPQGGSVQIKSGADKSSLKPVVTVFPDKPLQIALENGGLVARFEGLSFKLESLVSLEGAAGAPVRFRLTSTTRQNLNPEYPGKLSLSLYSTGKGLLVVNEVDLQEYLRRVLPSEMPPDFPPEALKAQAVAARTYAYARILADGFWKKFGADVDDSVSEQVYNNVPAQPSTDAAVEATRNQVLTFEGQPIQTFFFSTSPGSTANIEEVWPDRAAVPYFKAKTQANPLQVSLPDEAAALAFFKDWSSQDFYDGQSPLFRWKVALSRAELEAMLAKTLPALAKASPEFVSTPEGAYSPDAPEFSLGTLQDLLVLKRTSGGFATELEIQTSTGRYRVRRESNIRNLLRPNKAFTGGEDVPLERLVGEPRLNFPTLPSAAFALEEERDSDGNLLKISFWGGGYGHGVGMSQFGAGGLASRGKSYSEIVQHFYPGTALTTLEFK